MEFGAWLGLVSQVSTLLLPLFYWHRGGQNSQMRARAIVIQVVSLSNFHFPVSPRHTVYHFPIFSATGDE
jgi:hypothetical protein